MSSNYDTIPTMFKSIVENDPEKKLFNYKEGNSWISLKSKEVYSIVESISSALRSYELSINDKAAILSSTSYKWALCDYGIISLGAVTTSVYPSLLPNQIEYILC